MSDFVEAYSKSTGQKQRIPIEWLDHPVLGADFSKTPTAKAAEAAQSADTAASADATDTANPAKSKKE